MITHYSYSKQILDDLISRLNQYSIGAPAVAEMYELLSLLFKEEEAYVGSRFPVGYSTIETISKETKLPPEQLEPILEKMAGKGLVMDRTVGKKHIYVLCPTLYGFFEYTFMRLDKDLPYQHIAELIEKLFEKEMGKESFNSTTPMSRTLVYQKTLEVLTSEVVAYDKITDIIHASSCLAVQNCYCRQKAVLLGKSCLKKAPLPVCVSLNRAAEFLTRRGFARRASQEEILKVMEETERLGLVHITDNVRDDPQFICNCCSCCCEILVGVNCGFHHAVNPSEFQVRLYPEKCSGCGLCTEFCPVKALSMKSAEFPIIEIDSTKCIGCGICVLKCPSKAFQLTKRLHITQPPKNYITRHIKITHEKGRLHHSIGYMLGTALSGELYRFLYDAPQS